MHTHLCVCLGGEWAVGASGHAVDDKDLGGTPRGGVGVACRNKDSSKWDREQAWSHMLGELNLADR